MRIAPSESDRQRLRDEWNRSEELQKQYPNQPWARGCDIYMHAVLSADRVTICRGTEQDYADLDAANARLERLRAGDVGERA